MSTQGPHVEDSSLLFSIPERFHLSTLGSPVTLVISLLTASMLLAAIYYLSIPQLLMVAVAAVMLMALVQRVAKLQSFSESYARQNIDCSDGGAFSANSIEPTKRQAQPVVFDGGSFERSSITKFKKH